MLLSNLEMDLDQTISKATQYTKHQLLFLVQDAKIHQNPPFLLQKYFPSQLGVKLKGGSSWRLGDSCTSVGIDFLNTVTQHVPSIRQIIHFTEVMQFVH